MGAEGFNFDIDTFAQGPRPKTLPEDCPFRTVYTTFLFDAADFRMVDGPIGAHGHPTRVALFPYGRLRQGDIVISLDIEGRWTMRGISAEQASHCGDLTAWIDWAHVYGESHRRQGAWLVARGPV